MAGHVTSSGLARVVIAIVLALFSETFHVTEASATGRKRPVQVGAVTESWGPTRQIVGLRDGLVDLGYRENDDFVIGVRFTRGDVTALPAAVSDLVRNGADVLIASPAAMTGVDVASLGIPIILLGGGDPVEQGLIKSYARPGGNVTGVNTQTVDLAPKRLELFGQTVRGLKRVLYVYEPTSATVTGELNAYRNAARRLGITLVEKPVQTQADARAVLGAVRKTDVHGVLAPSSVALNIPGIVVAATSNRGVPTMFNDRFYVEQGGLASYGADLYASGRQAARLLDKVVRGIKPGDIPVESNDRVELVLNMKVVRALKLSPPRDLLHRVDRVVE